MDNSALKKCQEGQAALIQVFKERAAETARRDQLLRQWTVADAAWVQEHNRQLTLLQQGRQAAGHEIWYGNQKYDCTK